MNRKSMLVAAAIAALVALPAQQALAAGFSHGGGGGGGGMASHGGGGGGWQGGGSGGNWHGGGSGGNWHGGGSWNGGHWHGGYWGPGLGFYFGAPWFAAAWGYPYYPYYPYGYGYGYGYGPGYGSSTIIYDDPASATWGPAPADGAPPPGYPQSNVIPAPNQYHPAPAQAPVQFQYYCPDSGYYPAVRTCPRGWVQQQPRANAPTS